MTKIVTDNPSQTKKIGLKLAKKLRPGDIIGLIGDLGSGKTTFLQGLGRGLKIKQKILSPSFLQLKPYPVNTKKIKFLFHFDFYRLASFSQLETKGLSEYGRIKSGVAAVEWADRIKKFLPTRTKYIYFAFLDQNKRLLVFKNFKKEDLKFLASF